MLMFVAAGIFILALFIILTLYLSFLRPWHLRWGATREEVHMPMPGDEEVSRPTLIATRAITIKAPPEYVWPWLVQMGYRRAGWYSYDLIDNNGMPSARTIIPEFQHIKVGDIMSTDSKGGFKVAALSPNRFLHLSIKENFLQVSSIILLSKIDGNHTRMITRLHAAFSHGLLSVIYYLIFEPGDFIMMRKMMLGIKERAEKNKRGSAG